MGKAEHHFSTRDEVFTPAQVTDAIQAILGPIGLDPCSHPNSVVPARVRYYLPEYAPSFPVGTPVQLPATPRTLVVKDAKGVVTYHPVVVPAHIAVVGDGLVLPWGPLGLVFVNPPYSRLSDQPWFLRALPTDADFIDLRDAPPEGARRRELAQVARPDEVVWLVPVRTAGSWWQFDVVRVADMITFLDFRVHHVGEKDPSPFHQCLVYRGPRARLWQEKAQKMLGWTVAPREASR